MSEAWKCSFVMAPVADLPLYFWPGSFQKGCPDRTVARLGGSSWGVRSLCGQVSGFGNFPGDQENFRVWKLGN